MKQAFLIGFVASAIGLSIACYTHSIKFILIHSGFLLLLGYLGQDKSK